MTEQLFDDIAATFQEDVVILEAQYARIRELGDRSLFNMGSDVARVHAMRVIEKRLAAERGAVEAA